MLSGLGLDNAAIFAADSGQSKESLLAAVGAKGNVERGRAIFLNASKGACSSCHAVDGSQVLVGPNLNAIADKFETQRLANQILNPSESIAIGFGTTKVMTDDQVHEGILQRVTDDAIILRDKSGKDLQIPKENIVEQSESKTSMMPEGFEKLMSAEEFGDLMAYLQTLHQRTPAGSQDIVKRLAAPVTFKRAFNDAIVFHHPVYIRQIPGRSDEYLVLEQHGRVLTASSRPDAKEPSLVCDISMNVREGGATGLLGFAFHPKFQDNGRAFVKFQTLRENQIFTVVEEYRFTTNGALRVDESFKPVRLMEIGASTQDHNGGCIEFGPDGLLYIGMGDSGPQRDPQGHGQDLRTHLGKILRIDVDTKTADRPYGIPSDNPFANNVNALPEIYAYGFREPWRFSFDSKNKTLWVGDVGQDRFEEVSIVRKGDNHGWNVYEGHSQHSEAYRRSDARYVAPVFSYPRRLGVSVTGGYVYRGGYKALDGWYVFGDFESRRIWALREEDRQTAEIVELGRLNSRVVSFNEIPDHEIMVVGYDDGRIYQLDFSSIDLRSPKELIVLATSESAPVLWKYSTGELAADWMAPNYDDSKWNLGPGGFGTAGTPGAIVRTDWRTGRIALRQKFMVTPDQLVDAPLVLSAHHDEDAIVYINGREVSRLGRWTNSYTEVTLDRAKDLLVAGENTIAVECIQHAGGQYIDAGLKIYVADQK